MEDDERADNKLKRQGVTEVISLLDNDKCGIKGTEYLRKFFDVKRPKYIEGIKDPGDMTKSNYVKIMESIK